MSRRKQHRRCRGGNRLDPSCYRQPGDAATAPWRREFPADSVRRDITFRTQCHRAAARMLAEGRISLMEFGAYHAITDHSDGAGKIVYLRRATIGDEIGRAPRTVTRYTTKLEQVGLLSKVQRSREREDGEGFTGSSNLYRPEIPRAMRDVLARQFASAR